MDYLSPTGLIYLMDCKKGEHHFLIRSFIFQSERASLIAQLVKNLPAMQETQFDSWVWKIPWRRNRLHTPVFLGFPCGSADKESTCNVGDLGSIPGLRRSPGEGKRLPTPVFWTREFHGLCPWGRRIGHNQRM